MNNKQGTQREGDIDPAAQGSRGDDTSAPGALRAARQAGIFTKSTAFYVTLVVLAVLKAVLMRHYALGGWNFLSAIALEGAFIVLVLGLFDLAAPRRNCWVDLAAYSALSVLMLALTVYLAFYSELFNPAMMAMAGQLGTVSDVVAELIKPVYVLFLIDIPFLGFWAFRLQRALRAEKAAALATAVDDGAPSAQGVGIRAARRSRLVALFVVLSAGVFAIQIVSVLQLPWIDGVAIARARGLAVAQIGSLLPRSDSEDLLETAMANESDALKAAGAQSASNLATAPTTPGGRAEAVIEGIRGSLEGSRVASFPVGAYRGKNVIIIQVEALDDFVIQKTYNGQPITPNLNRLIDQSWYWPNTYSETGIGNTADAEFTVNTSLYSPRGQAATVAYANRVIPGLPRVMRGLGYYTFTIHQNKVLYWNRKQLYEGVGFNRYYDMNFFHGVDQMGPMGVSDEQLFKAGTPLLRALEASGTPFYTQFITLSAHAPFELTPESRRPFKTPADLQGSLMGKYLSVESYSDLAIGEFITQLKATKLWDNSIIMIYGDHTAMPDNKLTGKDALGAEKLLGRPYGAADRQRIPLIIHLPGQTTPVLRQDVAGQVDVMPTVADLVGADLAQIPHMGRSLFVGSSSFVPLNTYLPGGSFLNNRVLFMPGLGYDDGTAVNVKDNSPATVTAQEKKDFERMLTLTRISDEWVASLPTFKSSEMGWIPDPVARRAAQPYGALQKGIGSKKK